MWDDAVFNRANASYARRMRLEAEEEYREQMALYGGQTKQTDTKLEEDNKRLRKQNKILMERVAYYEKKNV